MRLLLVASSLALALLASVSSAHAQIGNCTSLEKVNCRLQGKILDFTHNHGADRRIPSAILGMPRDLYVYVPPGYCPARAYPLLLYFHLAYLDEHWFVATHWIAELDRMIAAGEFPPVIVACPDGTISGENRVHAPHSLYINGVLGRFEDHILGEVMPFLFCNFSIRPEREAHALLGISGGGFGAMSIALRHRHIFGAVATLSAPLNMRYWNCQEDIQADFDPATFRWRTTYDPDEIIARFYCGLQVTRARKYIEPVFGAGPDVVDRIIQVNPADLIFRTGLQPGELAMYVNYGGQDEYNFDAHAQSFAWLASQRGVDVTLECDPGGRHNLAYFRANHPPAYRWLACHLLPPLDLAPQPPPPQ
jgi:poly(3-hydroxybutyrate) depolymerase